MKRARCKCGRVKRKAASMCNTCHKIFMAKIRKEAQEIVTTGVCPKCGAKLVFNNALPGWWQCSCYGTWKQDKRFPENVNKPNCNFQCFTE